jgi:N-methylhydantoinase B
MAERTKIRPWGLKGGKPGMTGEYILIRSSGEKINLPSKVTVNISRGDKLIIRTPGGGGYGDVSNRDSRKILQDIENGLVTREAAKSDYGVIMV